MNYSIKGTDELYKMAHTAIYTTLANPELTVDERQEIVERVIHIRAMLDKREAKSAHRPKATVPLSDIFWSCKAVFKAVAVIGLMDMAIQGLSNGKVKLIHSILGLFFQGGGRSGLEGLLIMTFITLAAIAITVFSLYLIHKE